VICQSRPGEPPTLRATHRKAHPLKVARLAVVVSERPLFDVALQMLRRHMNLRAFDRSLQKRPEVLNPIDAHVTRYILPRVIDGLVGVVPIETPVVGVLVGVDGGVRLDPETHVRLHLKLAGLLQDGCLDRSIVRERAPCTAAFPAPP